MKIFFNILVAFASILVFASDCIAKDVKFIQVTDLHFSTDEKAVENYERAINKINNTKELDFVVFTGDNIDKSNIDSLKNFLQMSSKINVPYYIEIGNHDCFRSAGVSKKDYLKFVNKYRFKNIKSFNYTVKYGDLVFVFLDGMKEIVPSTSGYYRQDTLQWLDKVLTKNKNKNVVIFQHFPIFDSPGNANHNLYKASEYIELLKKHNNVLGIFAGHYHRNIELISEDGNYVNIVTPPAKLNSSEYREVYLIDIDNGKYEIYSNVVKF